MWRTLVREGGLALVALGVAILLFVAYELFGTNIAEQHSQSQLARQFHAAVSHAVASRPSTPTTTQVPHSSRASPTVGRAQTSKQSRQAGTASSRAAHVATASPPLPPPGGAIDHLVIPAIAVNRYVVQGVDEADLQMGPGHYLGTPLPGQPGNVAIAGHRTTFGAPFFRLNELVNGDLIYLTDLSGTTWVYSVRHQWVVAPTDVAVLDPTRAADLTLTTCNPRFLATSRLVVRAVLVEHLAPGAKLPGHLPVRATPPKVAAHPAHGAHAAHAAHGAHAAHSVAAAPTTAPSAGSSTRSPKVAGSTSITGSSSAGSGEGEDSPVVGPTPAAAASAASAQGGGVWTWVAALGWGALAIAVWAATRLLAVRRRRYVKLGVLFAGAVVCLVPLWFAFGAAVDLLPANF